jgi:uncharacterized protein (DUF4415 family)
MVASTTRVEKPKAAGYYAYQNYVCGSYEYFGLDGFNNKTCGRHCLKAARALDWLIFRLREIYAGPGRAALLEKIDEKLKADNLPTGGEVERVERHIQELDRQVSRLVAAIRTTDSPQLAQELASAEKDRNLARAELEKAKKPAKVRAPRTEPEKIVEQLRRSPDRVTAGAPALFNEVIRRLVTKIECRWNKKPGKRNACSLREASVSLYKTEWPAAVPAAGDDCPADIASGLVTFHVEKEPAPADPTEALADLLISAWEARRGPRRKRGGPAAIGGKARAPKAAKPIGASGRESQAV